MTCHVLVRALIQGSQTFVSLNSRLESNKEEEEQGGEQRSQGGTPRAIAVNVGRVWGLSFEVFETCKTL